MEVRWISEVWLPLHCGCRLHRTCVFCVYLHLDLGVLGFHASGFYGFGFWGFLGACASAVMGAVPVHGQRFHIILG